MLFQNKYVKKLKTEINQKLTLKQKKYDSYSYFLEIPNGKISFGFYKKSITISHFFNDEIPDNMQDKIFKLAIEKQSQIHKKCKCSSLGYDYIEFIFTKEVLKDITCDDLITTSENLKSFTNEYITKHLIKPNFD